MGFTYNEIRRAAYLLAPGAAPLTARYRALPFPEQWRDSLLALCDTGRDTEAEPYRTVPTYRMDGVLQSLAPDLVVRGRGSEKHGGEKDFWLYAPADIPHPLPDAAFERLLTAWVRNLRPEPEHRARVVEALAELRADPPRWHEVEVDLLGCDTTDGGTALPLGRQFQLATDHLARRVLALPPYDTGAGLLRFRAVRARPPPAGRGADVATSATPGQGPHLVVLRRRQHLSAYRPLLAAPPAAHPHGAETVGHPPRRERAPLSALPPRHVGLPAPDRALASGNARLRALRGGPAHLEP
ncbi:hypothetical protein GCM10018952_74630 [Streptosporangium vulgare]